MKKIISIVAVIAIITAILCIGANAFKEGETIPAGTKIYFNNNITLHEGAGLNWTNVKYKSNNVNYDSMHIGGDDGIINYGSTNVYNNGTWINQQFRTIEITEDFEIPTVTANGWEVKVLNLLNQGQVLKPVLENTIENTKATFSTSLTVATAIIAWLLANQLALVGLYMYILVALVATGKRFITGV